MSWILIDVDVLIKVSITTLWFPRKLAFEAPLLSDLVPGPELLPDLSHVPLNFQKTIQPTVTPFNFRNSMFHHT